MTTIDRYVLRLWIGPFLGGLFVVFGVLVLARALKLLATFSGNTEIWPLFGNLLVLTTPVFFLQIIPIAFFLALQTTINYLHQSSEMDALRASGLSYKRIFRIFFVVSAVLWLGMSYISMVLQPQSQLEFNNLLLKIYAMKGTIGFTPQRFTHGLDGISVYVEGKSKEGEYRGIILDDHRNNKLVIFSAKAAHFNNQGNSLQLQLYDGVRMEGKGANQRMLFFKQYQVSIPISAISKKTLLSNGNVTTMTRHELWLSLQNNSNHHVIAEWNRRILIPTTIFVLFSFVLPLTLTQKRSGRTTSLILGIILLMAVYNIQLLLFQKVDQNIFSGWSMWLVQGILLLVGLLLSRRASNGYLLKPLITFNRVLCKSSQTT